ncbi:peptidase M1-like protein [Herbihabitans rhizosphaerae]|uniref:Aminopeptidase N n=1 Tax=Herbihabitans rhizosphaerae TaxID=1872711 RepID=A0A4Q7KWW3_9PSEU|nr:M1 family metallopeptidase [Herbihabitans rhizosphaerae]RZS41177.1 peptidase M1-like protein [Herbihabitans rhizosphaerae]
MTSARTRTYSARSMVIALCAATAFGCTATTEDPPAPPSTPGPPLPSAAPAAGTNGADGAGDPYYPADGNGGYDVTGYDVTIKYDPQRQHLEGDTVVTAAAAADLGRFNLDLRGLDVASVTVNDAPAQFARAGDHELVITPAASVPNGSTFRTRVVYSGKPVSDRKGGGLGTKGWQRSTSGGAFAVGEPHSAAYWFPANETPKDKATFRVTATVPDGWSVVSIGHEEPSTPANGWTTYRWAERNRVATYLTTVAIDRWTYDRGKLPGTDIPLLSAYAPGVRNGQQLEKRVPEIIEFLSSKFGPYPQTAAGGIYINESIGFSLETNGRPTYANWAELTVVVHENAHQWFGNSVSLKEWRDICLNECFASYAQWLWDEAKEGKNLDEEYRSNVASVRGSNRFWSRKLYEMGAGNEFDAVYDKGQLALHALRRLIGDDVFNRVLREWPTKYRDNNASWTEFEDFAQQLSGKNLRTFFDAWFRGTSIPADEHLYPGSLHR